MSEEDQSEIASRIEALVERIPASRPAAREAAALRAVTGHLLALREQRASFLEQLGEDGEAARAKALEQRDIDEEPPPTPEGGFPRPGAFGRFADESTAVFEHYKGAGVEGRIGVMRVGTNAWLTVRQFNNASTPIRGRRDFNAFDETYESKERALDGIAREVVRGVNARLAENDGRPGIKRTELRKIAAWAQQFILQRSPEAQIVVDAIPRGEALDRDTRPPLNFMTASGEIVPIRTAPPSPAGYQEAIAKREEAGSHASPYHFALGWASGEAGLAPERVTDAALAEIPEEARPDFLAGVNAFAGRDVQGVESKPEGDDVPSGGADSQPDSSVSPDADDLGQGALFSGSGEVGRRPGSAGRGARAGGSGAAGGARVPGDRPDTGGAPGDQSFHRDDGGFQPPGDAAGGDDGGRGGESGDGGVRPEPGRSGRARRPSVSDAADLARRRDAQLRAESLPITPADADNIRDTLPMLTEGQQADVAFAERRFAQENGFGVLFTNGTGTGKTYTGLGIIKRAHRQGKKNILIIAPSDKVIADWIERGKNLYLDIKALPDTQSSGGGLAITTYANLATNRMLADVEWDLVVADESHHLLANKAGEATAALSAFRAITLHPDGRWERARMILRDEADALDRANRELQAVQRQSRIDRSAEQVAREKAANEKQRAAYEAFEEKAGPIYEAVQNAGQARPRATFLSATPFAYVPNVDLAEGYLFSFDDWGRAPEPKSGYNKPGHRDAFYIRHFGYKMRYGRLEQPDPEVDRGLMERNFNSWLKSERVLSGRMLEVDQDYDRRFVSSDHPIGRKIDEGLEWLREHKEFRPLYEIATSRFGYLERRFLLEAIKARDVVPMVKEHLALGRKVVIIHDYKIGGATNPFQFDKTGARVLVYNGDAGESELVEIDPLIERFNAERPDLVNMAIGRFPTALQTLTAAFPDALVFNGDVPKRQRRKAIEDFQKDGNGKNVLIVQSAAGREGLSAHDETGKHQRVTFNLGLPVQPTAAIQLEGRTFRLGQMSNAIFRYLNTGTTWERWAFAGTIAERAGTAENLALGDDARMLRQSFIDAFEEVEPHKASPEDGQGGKERDRAAASTMTPFDRAKTYYFAQGKKTSRNKSQEGIDYFATPEPLGLKMVEWADIRPGDSLLEPSAGHGAIARFLPEMHRAKMVEPSPELLSRAKLSAPHVEAIASRFEDLDIHNKADVIVMNPPFGTGGKTAMDHLAKAFDHLRDGGRIVALIPEGASMDKRFDDWLYGKDKRERPTNPYAFLVASIRLPRATFERAGTQVAARVVIVEKHYDTEKAQGIVQVDRDYSDAQDIKALFERIEDASMPERANPRPMDAGEFAQTARAEQNVPAYASASYTKDLFGNDLPLATGRGAPLFGPEAAPEGPGDVDAARPLPPASFSIELQPVTTGRVPIGVTRVESPLEAAHVFAALRKDYRERFAALVLDGGNHPIAYLPLFAGAATQTSVYPEILATEAYLTPGARKVWIAHNHPSGMAEPSFADIALTRNIEQRFGEDLGVALEGHVIIAGDKFIGMDGNGDRTTAAQKIPPFARRSSVPIVERRIVALDRQPRQSLTSPQFAGPQVKRELSGHTGVVYVDAQNRQLAAVPMRIEDMVDLRKDDRFRRLATTGPRHGAVGMFVYVSAEDAAAQPNPELAALNYAAAAKQIFDIKPLDIFIDQGPTADGDERIVSHATRGWDTAATSFFARGEARSPLVASLEAMADAPGAFRYPGSTATGWPEVIRDMAGARRWRAAPHGIPEDGRYVDGSILALYRGGVDEQDVLLGNEAFLEINRAHSDEPYASIGGKLDTEGALAYQMAMTWAHNNEKTLVPDPSGITPKNRVRRSEAMISSMLRHGTSRHLEPHASQYAGLLDEASFEKTRELMSGVEPGTTTGRKLERLKAALWRDEAKAETPEEARRIFESNLHNLALASSLLTHRLYPDAYLLEVTNDGQVRDALTEQPADVEVDSGISARLGIGRTTLARAVTVRSALQGVDTFDVEALRLDRDGLLQPGGVAILAERGQGARLSAAGAARLVAEKGPVFYRRGAQDDDAVPIGDIASGKTKPLRREGLSVSRVYRLLYAGLGESAVDSLVDAGILRVVASLADLPVALRRTVERSGNPSVDAVYDGERTAYIIAGNVDPDRLVPLVLHEIGEHFGLERLLGPEDYAKVLDKVRALHANGDRVVGEAWRHVFDNYRTGEGELELAEGSDDFVKEVIARVGESAPAMNQSWWRELLQMVRNALRRMGFTVPLTADDLMTLVRASLANVVREARQGRLVPSGEERVRSVAFHVGFHGSPYDFDAFSTEFIGSGEGAQAYGWGLYFSGKRAVAEWYRNRLSERQRDAYYLTARKDGKSISGVDLLEEYFRPGDVLEMQWGNRDRVISFNRGSRNPIEWRNWSVTVEEVVAHGDEWRPREFSRPRTHSTWPEAKAVTKALAARGWDVAAGRLYEVELAPKEEDYLDWDKPLSEQSEKVQEAIVNAGLAEYEDDVDSGRRGLSLFTLGGREFNPDGSTVYHELVRSITENPGDFHVPEQDDNVQRAASLYLKSIGIPGIRYLDGSSRGRGEGHHNYVVFDEADVSVRAKFSRAVRADGVPRGAASVIASIDNHFALRNVAGYLAAKQRGDVEAAQRVVRASVRREDLDEARRRFGKDVTYLAAAAAEEGGDNALPFALAAYYAAATGAKADGESVVQINRAHHTGASKLERLVSRPLFDGVIERDRRYVLVDDVVTRGGTIAELADHVLAGGGRVAGVVALAKSTKGDTLVPDPAHVRAIEQDEVLLDVTRRIFKVEPRALTRDEAEFIASSGHDAVGFRDRALAALRERGGGDEPGGVPPQSPAGGVGFARPASSGDPVLDEARRRAGLVRDTRNIAERSIDYLSRGWAAIREDAHEFRHALTQGALDRFHSLKYLEQTLGGIPAEQSAYVAARLSTGTSSVMRGMLIYGAPELRDGIIQRKEGSKGLLDILAPVKEDFDDWIGWMVGVRATRLATEKRERNLEKEHIEALVKLGEGKAERFMAVARDFARYKRAVLDLGEAAGLINGLTRPMWDQADWIPFYRVREAGATGPRGRRGLAGQTSGIRTLRGGESAINDPLENILMNFTHLVDASMKNLAMQRAAKLAGDAGLLEAAPHEWAREIVAAGDIKKRLVEFGVAEDIIEFMPPDVFKGLAAMWAIKPPSDKDVVRVMFGGKPAYYRVLDPLLLRALTAVDSPDLSWTAPMRAFKRVLTRGVTATPDFMLRNFLRDALSAWTISEHRFVMGLDSVRGAVKSLKEEGGMIDMMFAGGSFMGGYVNGNDPTATAEATRKALREKGWSAASVNEFMSTLVDTPLRWWEKWEELGSAVENANREAIFESAMRAGKTKGESVYEAKDLMDYSMRGDWVLFQVLGDIVPFFNARLQGLYKLGRTDPARLVARGGVLMLATLALLAANDGDDRYEELEEWDRDTYWHFWIGGQHLRVPKPFEIGVIFATLPERIARMIAQREAPGLTMKRLWWNLRESLNLVQWPQFMAPAAEVWANRSTFTGRPIEGKSDEGKLPEARYSANTSETMKRLAGAVPGAANATGMSPKRLEHLWRGYLGEVGAYALGLSDIAVRALTDAPPRPSMRADDVPLIKSFIREDPPRSTKWKTELYDMDREVEGVYRSIMAYRREGDEAKARELLNREKGKVAMRGRLSATTDRLAEIHRERERIYRDARMAPGDKRIRLDELQAMENRIAERGAKATRSAF